MRLSKEEFVGSDDSLFNTFRTVPIAYCNHFENQNNFFCFCLNQLIKVMHYPDDYINRDYNKRGHCSTTMP